MSYQGEVFEIPLGTEGLNGTENFSKASPASLLKAENVSYENGMLQKEGGAVAYNAIPVPSPNVIIGGHDWSPTPSVQRMIVMMADGRLLRDTGDGTFPTTLATLLTTRRPVFVEGGSELPGRSRKLFIFTASDTVVVVGDATTTALLSATTGLKVPPALRPEVPPIGGGGVPGNVDNGTHQYLVTYVTADGETTAGAISNPVTIWDKTVIGIVKLSDIPIGPPGTTAKNIYRSQIGGGGPFKFHSQIGNGITIVIDNLAFASLGAGNPPVTNTTRARPPEWTGTNFPYFGTLHEGRLWTVAPNDPHRIYYSLTDDHENFLDTGAGSLSIFPSEGTEIVGAISYKGKLVVFKRPRGIYLVDSSDVQTANWRVAPSTRAIGLACFHAISETPLDVIFVDTSGEWQLLSAVLEFGDIGGRSLSDALQMNPLIRKTLNLARLDLVSAVYYAAKREVHFAAPGTGQSINTLRMVVDGNRPDLPRFRFSPRDICPSLWLRRDASGIPRIAMGDDAGVIWLLDQELRSKGSVGYEARFQTMHTDGSGQNPALASKRKTGAFLELLYHVTGAVLNLNIIWDGLTRQTRTVILGPQYSLAGTHSDAILGLTFILGTSHLGDEAPHVLHGDMLTRRRVRIHGGGKMFSLEGWNSEPSKDIKLQRILLSCTIDDER